MEQHPIAPVPRNPPAVWDEAPRPERLSRARCAFLSVAYLPCLADARLKRVRNEIEIIIPGENAAFRAAYRTAEGSVHAVLVHGHHVTVIPAGQPHIVKSVRCGDGLRPSDAVVISLDTAFFEEKAREARVSEAPTLTGRYNAVDPFMRELGNELRSELLMQRCPPRTYLESLAAVIAVHLVRNYCNGAAAPHSCAGLAPHKLARVQAYIREHLAEAMRVQRLAAAVHMSTFHFARMFKQATGQPPHVYLTMQRIEYAKRLLRDGRLPLIAVAAQAGFQTQGHFTGVFHRYAGVTPRIFRLNSRDVRMLA
jgi:AraC family transcriptional regulator